MIVMHGKLEGAFSRVFSMYEVISRREQSNDRDYAPKLSISDDMPEGGGGETTGTDGPPVEASDDDDGGDSDGEPARRRPLPKKSPPSSQPALLGFEPLSQYVSFGRTRIYQLIAAGQFPPPVKIGKSSRWVRAEIDQWLSSQIKARQQQLTAR